MYFKPLKLKKLRYTQSIYLKQTGLQIEMIPCPKAHGTWKEDIEIVTLNFFLNYYF